MHHSTHGIIFFLLITPIFNSSFIVVEDDFKEFQPNLTNVIKNFFKTVKGNSSQTEVLKLNMFFDNQLKYVKYYGYYVIPLPNIDARFKHKIEDTVYSGDISLTSGLLVSLDLKRKCDISLSYDYPMATIELVVGFDKFEYIFHYKSNFMSTVTKGGIIGTVEDISWMLIISLDVVDMNLSIPRFKIQKFGEISSRVEGESKWKSWLFKNVTEPLINSHIRPILTKYTKNITFSLINWYNDYLVLV